MLLIALLGQVASEPIINPPSPIQGAIVVDADYLAHFEPDSLGFARRRLVPATGEEQLLSAELISEDADPIVQAFWTMPVARVDQSVITIADLMFGRDGQLAKLQKSDSGNLTAERIHHSIAVWLPRAIERVAVWNAVKQDFPQEEFQASWKRHEQAWEAGGRLSVTRSGWGDSEATLEKYWKPMFIEYSVTQDYYHWKFITEQPADPLHSVGNEPLKPQWIAAFQRNAVQRAKVETPFAISTKSPRR